MCSWEWYAVASLEGTIIMYFVHSKLMFVKTKVSLIKVKCSSLLTYIVNQYCQSVAITSNIHWPMISSFGISLTIFSVDD